jgi:hypothetical protein
MRPAITAYTKKAFMAITFLAAALVSCASYARASAGSPQSCTTGSNCTIGEFLYDDEYIPITTATCNITSRYPSGSLFLDSVAMTAATENDGWYYHTFTTPSTTGHYRTQICCTVGTDLLCVDKSFEAVDSTTTDPDSIASAVWGYSNRTLSSFGSLISDIWGFSSRTLSSFGDLVSSIWSNSSRTLTSDELANGESIATESDLQTSSNTSITTEIEEVKETSDENRLLLEKLVNKPIIQYFLEDEAPDLGSKLVETKAVANQLYVNNQYIASKVGFLIKNWGKASNSEILDNVIELNELLGEESDIGDTRSVFGSINWIKSSWEWQEVEAIYEGAKLVKQELVAAQANLVSKRTSEFAHQELTSSFSNFIKLEKLIGTATDTSNYKTLYGKIRQTEEIVLVLDARQEEVEKLLSDWESVKSNSQIKLEVQDLKRKILAVNKVPKGSTVLRSYEKGEAYDRYLKNSLLSMRGLIVANKLLLSKGAGVYLANSWLEEGSIVIKTLVINPSRMISQEAELKYYLPPEVREEDVISSDEPLEVKYDIEKDQYYIEGKIPLAISETKVFSVKLVDIWVISQEEVDSLKAQAEELAKPLESTSYFAQGVTLKSDIDASLDKIVALQKKAVTPEQRIRAYREALIEKNAVDEKIAKLQDLVSLAGSAGTLFGFVGSVNALAVWGLIIIMITGFVFLVLYMRKMTGIGKVTKSDKKGETKGKKTSKKDELPKLPTIKVNRLVKFASSFFIFGIVVATISGVIVAKIVSKSVREEIAGESKVEEVQEEVISEERHQDSEEGVGGQEIVKVSVPIGNRLNVRKGPSLSDEVIYKLAVSVEAIKIGEFEDWINIVIDEKLWGGLNLELQEDIDEDENRSELTFEGWVHKDFVVEAEDSLGEEVVDESLIDEESVLSEEVEVDYNAFEVMVVIIADTPTGWLRVRNAPWGDEITKVLPGDKYSLLEQEDSWYQIELAPNEVGWVHSKYATLQ